MQSLWVWGDTFVHPKREAQEEGSDIGLKCGMAQNLLTLRSTLWVWEWRRTRLPEPRAHVHLAELSPWL